MLTMIGKRLMFAIPSLIGVVIVTFLLTRALPGDPAAYFAGPAATKEAVEQIRKKLGLDKPLIEQFFRYTNDLAHGDFGNSLTTGQPVAADDDDGDEDHREHDRDDGAAPAGRRHAEQGAARDQQRHGCHRPGGGAGQLGCPQRITAHSHPPPHATLGSR